MRSVMKLAALAAVATAAACASTQQPASLSQAVTIYERLAAAGAERRVEGEMIKSREAIAAAQNAVATRQNQEYVNGLSHIALRTAQTAEAEEARLAAVAAADSLQRARMTALLNLSEAQRQQLAQQQQLSQEEIEALRARNMLVSQEADSLRRANEAANAALNAAFTQLRTLVTEITNLRETSRGIVISLSDILFDVNKATLKPGAQSNIGRIAAVLKQYPDKQIAVEGHTDATGSDSYNQKLSEDRAAAVRAALVQGGVDPASITSKGLGETTPVATNDTPAGRQQNRRVEVIVLGAGTLADAAANPPGGAPVRSDTTMMMRDTMMRMRDSMPMRPDTTRMPPDTTRMPPDTTRRPPR